MGRGVLVIVLVACFDPELGDRPFACERGACPPGYLCADGLCVRGAGPADAPLADDAAASDARPADARPIDAAAGDAGSRACAPGCGPESCAGLACGRSPCGYPCAECEPTALAEPCLDHYGQMLVEGQRGLRSCPGEADRFQTCTCTGGGPNAWTSCVSACVEAGCSRAGQIGCGFESCEAGEVCCRRGRDSTCARDGCGLSPTAACDGPEDCPGGVCCADAVPETARCVSGTSCGAFLVHCHSADDCPSTAPRCCATAPGSGSKACYATPQTLGCN